MCDRLRQWSGVVVLVTVLSLSQSGCELDEVDLPERNENIVEVTRMGSIGNSLTAGFQNGGIHEKGQVASFANLVSQVITGLSMQLPLVGDPGLGSESGFSPLFMTSSGDITREPLTQPPTEMAKNLKYPFPYDNLAVPGATTKQILNTMLAEEAGNPLFDLILRNAALPGGGTCMRQLERLRPDVITAWSGNNEILGGALSGEPQSDDPAMPGYVVPLADFQIDFRQMCDRIEALQPKMVAIANVPPITAIPFTRFWTPTVPSNPQLRWNMDEDDDGDGDDVELVLLPAPISDCAACYSPVCEFTPDPCRSIPGKYTLTFSEVALINSAIAQYNEFIEQEVTARGWAFVDVHAAFIEIANDTDPSAVLNVRFPFRVTNPLTGEGVQNKESAFTLDGVHPSERGHARMANEFLAAINATYGTDYPFFDVGSVQNVAGFERFGSAAKPSLVRFTPAGRAGLQAVVEMLSTH